MSLIKIGDYGLDLGWQDIHMIPENSVKAHKDLGAKVMLPIHWGTFALSNHDWDEPIKRAVTASNEEKIQLVTPMLGESYEFGSKFIGKSWWTNLK